MRRQTQFVIVVVENINHLLMLYLSQRAGTDWCAHMCVLGCGGYIIISDNYCLLGDMVDYKIYGSVC